MKNPALPALVLALAIPTASARGTPPMDVMGPYDTPASAADRIVQPDGDKELGRRHAEAGLENARALPPELPPGFEMGQPLLEIEDIGFGRDKPRERREDDRWDDDGRRRDKH